MSDEAKVTAAEPQEEGQVKKKFKMPHVYVLLFALIFFAALLTYILPAGEFERVEVEVGPNWTKQVLVPGSYHQVEASPVNAFEGLISIYRGLVDAAEVVFLSFLAYASFYLVVRTGSMNRFIGWLLRVLKGKQILMIPVFFYVFALGGSMFGMFGEVYGFIPVFVGLGIAMGYDAIVGLSMVCLSTAVGFAAATTNPYTVGLAQKFAEVPLFSGIGYRTLSFVVFTTIAMWWTMRYARKIKADPSKSIMADVDMGKWALNKDDLMKTTMSGRDKLILVILALTMVVLVFGTLKLGWGFEELIGLFLTMGIASAIIAGWGPSKIASEFVDGCRDIVFGALIVGISRAVLVVLQEGNIIDTVILGLAQPLNGLPSWVAAQGMLVVQSLINFFIPSGSGQAATTMPIMAPLADLLHVTRQTAVLAYQYGDGFSNILWPTADIPIICAIAHVPLEKWWKFFVPLFGIMFVVQMLFLMGAVLLGYN